MHQRISLELQQQIYSNFLLQFPPQNGWQYPDGAHPVFDLLLWRKNGLVSEKIVGFWQPSLPPTAEELRYYNLQVRKASGRYTRIYGKFLIVPEEAMATEDWAGFKAWALNGQKGPNLP